MSRRNPRGSHVIRRRNHARLTNRTPNLQLVEGGAGTRSRTRGPLITSQVLYQLSYTGTDAHLPNLHEERNTETGERQQKLAEDIRIQ